MSVEKTCKNCGTPITKEYCEGYPDVCEHWSPQKAKTNGDRIRTMNDYDLAEFLCSITDCFDGKCPAQEYCRKGYNGMREYIKRRAEEESQ